MSTEPHIGDTVELPVPYQGTHGRVTGVYGEGDRALVEVEFKITEDSEMTSAAFRAEELLSA